MSQIEINYYMYLILAHGLQVRLFLVDARIFGSLCIVPKLGFCVKDLFFVILNRL